MPSYSGFIFCMQELFAYCFKKVLLLPYDINNFNIFYYPSKSCPFFAFIISRGEKIIGNHFMRLFMAFFCEIIFCFCFLFLGRQNALKDTILDVGYKKRHFGQNVSFQFDFELIERHLMIVVATAMRLERYIEDESVYEVSVYWENQRISIVRIPQEHFITYEVKPEEGMSQVKIESGIIKEEEGGHQIAFRVEELRDFTPSFNTLEGPKDNRVKRELPIKIEIEEKECAASRAKKPKRKKRTTHQKKAKQIALQRHRQGLTSIRIGSELNVPFSTVRTWIRCYRMNGELKNRWSLFNSKQIIKMLDDSFKPGDLVTYKDIQKMAIKLYDNYDFFKASASWITQLVNKLKLRQTYKIHR